MGGTIPDSDSELKTLGEIANAFGATCVQSVGGVPVTTSRYDIVHELLFVPTELCYSSVCVYKIL